MKNFFKTKTFYVLTSVLVLLIIVLSIMKLLSARTYDPSNPRSRPNSYLLTYSLEVNLPVDKVFDFITYEKQNVWPHIASEHEGQKFDIINSEGMTLGAVILCEEFADGEGTSHRYVVKEVIKNKLIYFASEPSIVYMENNSGEMKEVSRANSYVYYDMESLGAEKTKLTQTLVIQMPNFFIKFLADSIGGEEGKEIWESHLEEELKGLVNFMVAEEG